MILMYWLHKYVMNPTVVCNNVLEISVVYTLADGKAAYVSRGFSIKGRPDLAQETVHLDPEPPLYQPFDTKVL
jgi:hypothetical protein